MSRGIKVALEEGMLGEEGEEGGSFLACIEDRLSQDHGLSG